MNKIITVSRQFGSGGRTIGKLTAERLGIPCYDHEFIEEVAKSCGFAKEYIEAHGEYSDSGNLLGRIFKSANRFDNLSNQDKIWIEQRKIILKIAEEPCVIVGRCANYILRDRDDVLNVFIHADDKFRAERIVSLYGEKPDKPEKRLRDNDRRRAAYYKDYTETEWGVASNYHLALDSGKLGIDSCVNILVSVYNNK